jgi:hypothetical protein
MLVQNKKTMSGAPRIKWHKYRCLVAAGLLVNVFLINYFFFDTSAPRLSTFGDTLNDHGSEVFNRKSPFPQSSGSFISQGSHPPSKADQLSSKPQLPIMESGPPVVPPPPYDPPLFKMNDLYFNGNYIGWPPERVRNETKHQPGLVFMCDNNSGGIDNIRNFILTWVRYAFDAGATGIILPKIQRHSVQEPTWQTSPPLPFSPSTTYSMNNTSVML